MKTAQPNSVVVIWRRFGPYHHARARAAADQVDLVGLEICSVDNVNSWAIVEKASGFKKCNLLGNIDVEKVRYRDLRDQLFAFLDRQSPSAVAVTGYAARESLIALKWALLRGRTPILMTESNEFDFRRRFLKEWIKRELVQLFSGALVGGTTARQYLQLLGLPPEQVMLGYDVVDNKHFQAAGEKQASSPTDVGMLRPFFLTSARFVPKKNLLRLLQAYAGYRGAVGDEGLSLVILGDGALRQTLEAKRNSLGLQTSVVLPGYKQYEELPKWYGAAACFILPSTTEQWGLVVNEAMAAGLPVLVSKRCGCAFDLVQEGINGFTFDPYDVRGLSEMMIRIAQDRLALAEMGLASQKIVAEWGPSRFGIGLRDAVNAGKNRTKKKPTALGKFLLWVFTEGRLRIPLQ